MDCYHTREVNVIESVGSVPPFDTPLFRPSTAESMVVSGTTPTVNVQVAGVGSALLAASTAYTENVDEPSSNGLNVVPVGSQPGSDGNGDGPVSSHVNVMDLMDCYQYQRINVIESVGSVPPFDTPLFRPSTAESMVVSGTTPTVNVQVAGVGIALLAASTAYTENVDEPSSNGLNVVPGGSQPGSDGNGDGPGSSHVNVSPFDGLLSGPV